jgi:hypothetical protein
MSGEPPGTNDWANPGQPVPPPAELPGSSIGWGTTPPTPPPLQGWVEPAPPPPPPPAWGAQAPPPPGGWANPAPTGWTPNYVQQAPKPGVIPLRPLGVGELLDGAFTTIRRYPAATLGLSAAVMLFVQVIQLVTTYYFLNGIDSDTTTSLGETQPNGDYLARLFTVDGIVLLVTLIATVLLTGMLTVVVGQAVLGRTMGINAAWRGTRPLLWRLLGATVAVPAIPILIIVAGAVPGGVIMLIGIGAGQAVVVLGAVIAGVGGLGATVYAIYISGQLGLTTPALVLEKLTVRGALRRSRALVKGSWWRIVGIWLLAQLIASVIAGIIVVPFDIAGGLGNLFSSNTDNHFTFTTLLLSGIGGLLSSTLVRPFSAGVVALLYIDRRMRAEALDLTLQQAATNQPL